MNDVSSHPPRRIRFRYVYMCLFTILILFGLFASDPDVGWIKDLPVGATFVANNLIALRIITFVTLLHLSRRALIDYVRLGRFFFKALETPAGAGLAIVGVGLFMVAISLVMIAAAIYPA